MTGPLLAAACFFAPVLAAALTCRHLDRKDPPMSRLHTCPVCKTRHSVPKPVNALFAISWALAFTAVEVLAALALDGWISWALWVIAARNVLIVITTIYGLAKLATEALTDGGDA